MYLELNNIFRSAINSTDIEYTDNANVTAIIPVYYATEYEDATGAHAIASVYQNPPASTEIGVGGARNVTGYIQFLIKVPTTDNGIDWSLSDMSNQVDSQFPRENFIVDDIKVEWLEVEQAVKTRINGFSSVTMRVQFKAHAC